MSWYRCRRCGHIFNSAEMKGPFLCPRCRAVDIEEEQYICSVRGKQKREDRNPHERWVWRGG